ncbi:helix-turn-helix domain-containing protein [Aurantivibrio plasticivorans]
MNTNNKTPKLYIWQNYGLFLGTTFVPLSTHSVTADQLLLVIEGEIIKKKENGEEVVVHSILIRAGATIDMATVDASTAVIAIFYLDPLGYEFSHLQGKMTKSTNDFYYNHPEENALIETCLWLREQNLTPEEVERYFKTMLVPEGEAPSGESQYDPRIIKVMHLVRDNITENRSVKELADAVHVSESRLRKLFKEQFGVPITRYRLGCRLMTAVIYASGGASITDAAMAAGFASTAHFSTCFRAVFGIHPSAMLLKPPFLDVRIDKSITIPDPHDCVESSA